MGLDVVGIGALNVDYILSGSALEEANVPLRERLRGEFGARFERSVEKRVERDLVERYVREFGLLNFEVSCGGSAFNTIRALHKLDAGLRLGYLGIAGSPVERLNLHTELRRRGIEAPFVKVYRDKSLPAGRCLSFPFAGEHRYLTCPDANDRFAAHLRERAREVVDWLCSARWIHVTSFLDDVAPGELLSVLAKVKERCPAVRISIDPGYVWAQSHSDAVKALISCADHLFMTEGEFRELGGLGGDDLARFRRIVQATGQQRLPDQSLLVALRTYNLVTLYQQQDGGIPEFCHDYPVPQVPLDQIRDETGAGDVFAAGFIAGRLEPVLELNVQHWVSLGSRMVEAKLREVGDRGYDRFADILRAVKRQAAEEAAGALRGEPVPPPRGRRIFIAHGRDKTMLNAVKLLVATLELEPVVLVDEPGRGRTLAEMLDDSRNVDFAVVVATGDDVGALKADPPHLRPRARQNVVYEWGFAHGHLRRPRLVVLVEPGLELPSDNLGLKYIDLDPAGLWRHALGKALIDAGFDVDLARL